MSGRVDPRRWQQQHRACTGIRHRLDPWVSDRARACLAQQFHLDEIGDAQSRNVERGAVVPISVKAAHLTVEPTPPVDRLVSLSGGAIRFGGFPARGTGVIPNCVLRDISKVREVGHRTEMLRIVFQLVKSFTHLVNHLIKGC